MNEVVDAEAINQKDTKKIYALILRWLGVVGTGALIYLLPVPGGITNKSWALLAIFISTIVGLILRPIASGAMVLIGVGTVALTQALPVKSALAGYSDPVVWLVLVACFMSRAMIDTGLGHRIALVLIKLIGRRTLGLGYALVVSDLLLAMIIPSTGARSGGIIYPISRSISETYDSRPGETADRLGTFLVLMIYQCEVILCAMFLTGQASNLLIRKFALDVSGVDLNYTTWMICGLVPGIVSLLVIPRMIYRFFPPLIKETPTATEFAKTELIRMGPMSWREKGMLVVFVLIAFLWITKEWNGIDYTVTALIGICALLVFGIVSWDSLVKETTAWDLFIWYGGLVGMATALGETGITKRFAEAASSFTSGFKWWWALAILVLVYFYAHYAFASISTHALAMYTPFLIVILAAGSPVFLSVAILSYLSNLMAGLTHYGTTPGPIYFAAGYVSQQKWWKVGFIASIINIIIWSVVGTAWWKILGKF